MCESEPNTVPEVGKGFNGLQDEFAGKRRDFFEWRRRCNRWRRIGIETYIDWTRASRPRLQGNLGVIERQMAEHFNARGYGIIVEIKCGMVQGRKMFVGALLTQRKKARGSHFAVMGKIFAAHDGVV